MNLVSSDPRLQLAVLEKAMRRTLLMSASLLLAVGLLVAFSLLGG